MSALGSRSALPNSTTKSGCIRVLGVDPAVAGATGYGVIELDGHEARALHFGALRMPARNTFDFRLREIHSLIEKLLVEFQPQAVAVESVFAALNMRTALKLSEVRGVILLAAAQAGVPAHSYSPREVKSSVTGYGAASKEQMQQMVRALFGLREAPHPADAADAMAIALCHAQQVQATERMKASATRGGVQTMKPARRPTRRDEPRTARRVARV